MRIPSRPELAKDLEQPAKPPETAPRTGLVSRMPQLNDAGDPGVVNEIFVAVGDVLAIGDRLMAVEMEKAIVEIEAARAGTVKHIPVQVGDEVKVGQVLVELE